jgi:hypothetical protein
MLASSSEEWFYQRYISSIGHDSKVYLLTGSFVDSGDDQTAI